MISSQAIKLSFRGNFGIGLFTRAVFAWLTLTVVGSTLAKSAEPAVKSYEKQAEEVAIVLDTGHLVLRPMGDRAIRVCFSGGVKTNVADYSLLAHPPTPNFDVVDTKDAITVTTPKMRAVVDRVTGALSFQDLSGNVLLAEIPGGRVFKPNAIQNEPAFIIGQSFQSPTDEHLLGLGQYQDGLWNWRGLPIEMRQLNTQIAVPMLMSSEGYGLLWNNASRTDFNLPGDVIALHWPDKAPASGADGPIATEQLQGNSVKSQNKGEARVGTYTSSSAGEYVFCTRDGDRRNNIAVLIDGKQIAGVTNLWTPRAVVGRIKLGERQTVSVAVYGGGRDVKLFARPIADTTTFQSDYGNAIDYTVFYGPRIDDVIASYRALSGEAPLWPKWAYGLWQCRERYSSDQQIIDVAAEFRKRHIPVDLIVQDWQYWGKHGWGSYEWDETKYPNPAGMIEKLHGIGMKFMISVWCNPHGKTLEELKRNNVMAGDWIDLFNPLGRQIRWENINRAFFSIGTDGWWGDATEPGDPGTDLLGKKISVGAGDMFTSAYPLMASESLYEGQRASDPSKRVCILTRSAWPGMQRYAAAAWSGDINGNWETFKRQIPAGLNFCITGQPYWTTDCGGFFHPADQYKSADYNELLIRWFQWSTFCPILRIHGYKTETEMWKWLPETQEHLLAYDQLRYRMLPYNYSVAWRVTHEGYTIMRALGMDFPGDAKAWSVGDEYMFGPAFLVTPVTSPNVTNRNVYLPANEGGWIDFWTGDKLAGGAVVNVDAPISQIPLLARAGSIVPFGPALQFTGEKPADPIELRVYPGADGSFDLYEDEGDNYNYEKGVHAIIPMKWDEHRRILTIGDRVGRFPGMLEARLFRVVIVSPGHGTGIDASPQAAEVHYTGATVTVSRFE